MLSGSTKSEWVAPSLAQRIVGLRSGFGILSVGVALLGFGAPMAIRSPTSLAAWALPVPGALVVLYATCCLIVVGVLIPRSTLVWFRYERQMLHYRRARDAEIRTCRTLDMLRINRLSRSTEEMRFYVVLLVDSSRLRIFPYQLENGEELAERLAADIAQSPRWMFS